MGKIGSFRAAAGKISKATSIANKVTSIASMGSKVSNLGSSADLSSISGMMSGIPGAPKIDSITSSIPSFSSVNSVMSKIEGIKSGPVGAVMKAYDAAMEAPPVKEINKAVDNVKAKKDELLAKATDRLVEKVKESDIQNSPPVTNAINTVKGKLNDNGINLDEYVSMYKNSQE